MKMRRSLCIVAALVAVIGLASAAQDPEWWKTSILYQIYPRSFADSDGDGNGDLKGILDHVPYLKELGVGIVWLSPIYASPMGDQGYDVSDFKSVNPLFGNLSDAIELIKACQREGIRFFMDFVPNHSSNEHAWFNLSRHRDRDYEDFYIWKDAAGSKGGQPIPPNNWVSMFNAVPAWTYDNVRKQFYLHQFAPVQPDLNYRNTRVVDAMYEQMKFWLDLGVDGFRMDAVPFLVEDSSFKDEPKKDGCTSGDCNVHIYTQNQPETYSVLQQLDDRMSKDFNNTKFLFLEVYASPEQTMKYFYKRSSPFNFIMIQNVSISTNATEMKRLVDSYLGHLPENAWPNWVTGNHDNSRVGTRFGEDFVDAANMLTLLLPGASVTFQGEELGMLDTQVPKDRILDCCGRDPERTPFQWNNSKNAGFSSADRTWLPVNPNYVRVNVADEDASGGNSSSHLQVYRRLATLRKELAANISTETATIGDWVFLFTRKSPGGKVYYVVINMNNEESEVSLKEAFSSMPAQLVVHTASLNLGLNQGQVLDTGAKLKLRPRSGMVVSGSSAALPSAILVLLLSTLAAIFSSQN